MRIKLKRNWDEIITWENRKKSAFFVDTPQSKKLFEYLYRKNSGSILISGQKGAGKTSSTIAVVDQLEQKISQNNNEIVLPVYISSLYFEATQNDKNSIFNVLEILKQLIKRLGFELKEIHKSNNNVKFDEDCIQKLLRDLSFTELVYKEKRINLQQASSSSGLSVEVQNSLGAGYGDGSVSAKAGVISKLKSEYKELNETKGSNELFATKIGITIEDLASDIKRLIKSIESQQYQEAKFYSKFLNWFFRWWKSEGNTSKLKIRIIFIFDELDFFDGSNEQRKLVLETLKKIKSLLTLSEAHFVFVVGEYTYTEAVNPNGKYWTLFTERVFFHRLEGNYLSSYLDKIVKDRQEFDRKQWEKYKWSLIAKSKHNFFELVQIIKTLANLDSDGEYVLNIDVSDTESETLAPLHYAFNTIYEYFLQNPRNSSLYNQIYEVLDRVEMSFLSWLHGNGNKIVDLNIPNGEKTEREIAIIRNSVHAFLSYLYKLSGVVVPSNLQAGLPHGDFPSFQPSWEMIRPGLSMENVKNGIKGPISPEERELIKETQTLFNKFNSSVHLDHSIDNLSHVFTNKVRDVMGISENEVNELQNIVNTINNETYFSSKRQQTLVERGLAILNMIRNQLANILVVNKRLFKKEWGNIEVNEKEELIFYKDDTLPNQLDARVTLFPKLENDSFLVEFEYLLSINSIFNVLLITSDLTGSEVNDEFYFARFDSRKPTKSVRNGILFKNAGTSGWGYVKEVKKLKKSRSGVWSKGKVILHNNFIMLMSFNKTLGKYLLEEKYEINKPVKYIGFSNQEEMVKLRNIKIREAY